jgi:uncharacterized protein (DUF433 family)
VVTSREIERPGIGLYTPNEAAVFARLRLETFNRWFFGDHGEPVLRRQLADSERRVITFWDLIQANAVRTLRMHPKGKRLTLQHIRRVVKECEEKELWYPLARKHILYVFGGRLILRTADGEYVGLDPKIDRDQLYHARIVEPFLEELSFNEDGMATSWTPLTSPNFRVSLDADRRFGMPAIEPGGILVSALVSAAHAEGSIEEAADSFETKPEAVVLAMKYEEYISPAA